MSATSIDLSQIKTDALSAASTFRTLIGLGTLATQSPTGTANSTTYLRGDFTWQTISGGGTWGSITGTLSSQTDLQSALDAKASLSGATFTGRITTPSVLLSGNYSATAWTTSGVGLSHTARTLTDTSSTGTVATAYTNVLGGNTIAASNATTFTDYASLFIGSPSAGSNVTITNAFSLITQGAARFGGQLSIPTAAVLANSFCPGNIANRGFFYDSSFLNVIYIGLNGTARFAFDWGNLRLGATNAYGTSSGITWCSGDPLSTSVDLALVRDAANTLAQRNSTNAQTFRLYRTADGSPGSNYERLALSSTTYSGGVYNTILCETAGTGADNINLVLGPAGTGAILAQVPDGTATGGNARGENAFDYQTNRNAATQVASGLYAALLAGQRNTASGNYSTVIGGYTNLSSGYMSFAGGESCTSRNQYTFVYGRQITTNADYAVGLGGYNNYPYGQYSVVLNGNTCETDNLHSYAGGNKNWATADYAFCIGGKNTKAYNYGMWAFSSGGFADNLGDGSAQFHRCIARNKTTNATPTTLFLDGASIRYSIPSGKVFAFVAKISGIKSDGSAVAFYTRKGAIKNVGGTTSLVGSIETIGTDTEDNTSTDVAITADDTNDALQINVTGIAAETWRWVAVVEGVEIGYGT